MTTPDPSESAKPCEHMNAGKLKTAAQELSRLALETLGGIMRGEGQDAIKLAAAREILDRAHGRPRPAAAKSKTKASKAAPKRNVTVIVKRFSEVTPEEQAAADATKRGER